MTVQSINDPKVHLERREVSWTCMFDDCSVKEEEFGVSVTTDDGSVDKGSKGAFGEERGILGMNDEGGGVWCLGDNE